jgi:hypothetical protein
MSGRAFTFKSVAFGLVGLLIVCVFPPYSTTVLKLLGAIGGYLPVVPLFLIVLLSLVWNGVAGRISRRLALSSRELAVVAGLMLVVSWIPAMQQAMVRQLALPRYEELTTNATWQEAEVTARLPDRLFPRAEDGEPIGEKTHFGMIQGGLSVKEVPYGVWVGPLLHWMPFLLVLSLSLMALTYVVHRQWTIHEQLQYPLASVVNLLVRQDSEKPGGAIFRNRAFWFGCAFVFGFHLLRYLWMWFPDSLPEVPGSYGVAWYATFPAELAEVAKTFNMHWVPVTFAAIGIAYFISTDVSLSIGLTAPLGTLFAIQFYLFTGNPVSTPDLDVFRAGGFIALGIILAYTGRSYYFPILLKAVWPRRGGAAPDPGGVWAARVFLTGYVALVAIVMGMGVGFLMAWVLVTFSLLIFLVTTRLVCETGLPTITTGVSIPVILSGLIGPAALGAGPLMFMTLLGSTIVMSTSTQLVMPYMATGLKLIDDNKIDLRRFAAASKIAIVVALAVGFAAVIAIAYTKGEGNLLNTERAVWTQSVRQVLTMIDFGQYEASQAAQGFARLSLIKPDGDTVGLMLAGIVAVTVCYMLRFRFTKWPLHPLFFVVLGTSIATFTWMFFLLGCLFKTLIIKLGGGQAYKKMKPLFAGLIVGEFTLLALTFIVGLVYHSVTGKIPVYLHMVLGG